MKYIAFLRGINISGKNKISMSELKYGFEKLDYNEVKTYLNSGNVVFESSEIVTCKIIEEMIQKEFQLEIPVYLIPQSQLQDILNHAPVWWNTEDKTIYDNLIFILDEHTPQEIIGLIGEPTDLLERIDVYQNVIFWSFDRSKYQKCNWWKKTACNGIADLLTIRTANTIMKVCK